MTQKSIAIILLHCIFLLTTLNKVQGQPAGCIFKDPVFTIDFGTVTIEKKINLYTLKNYVEIYDACPNDGYFSFVSKTSDCYSGHWITIPQDHTPNDVEGKMMLVNAAYTPGTFFITPVYGLAGNTTYQLGVWMLNVCSSCPNEIPAPPQFSFVMENTSGKKIANFITDELKLTGGSAWIQFSGIFTTPENAGPLLLRLADNVRGGCGNDFAMDDITIRECVLPKPVVKETKVEKPVPPIKQPKPVVKNAPPVFNPLKKEVVAIAKIPVKESPAIVPQLIKEKPLIAIPPPIVKRANPIVKQIETAPAEMVIDLYDNGEIDGDTVSIYHNNVLIVSRAGLSAKPISFHITVDALHPHHELVMVANNLGSIPPNTSLMIVTTRDNRYEVFISSSEQKNAKVVIDLQKQSP